MTGTVASYSVSPALPAGLTLNTTSGQITGTPTAAVAQASYVITASNATGSTTFSLSMTVNAPPAPTASVSWSVPAITVGSSSTLTWSSTGASSCTTSGAWSASIATSGTQVTTPAQAGSYDYTLSCQNSVGVTTSQTATIIVTTSAPPVVDFSPSRVNSAATVTLNWTATNASACTASGTWSGAKALAGSAAMNWPTSGSQGYVLTCQNAAGTTTTASITVTPKFALGAVGVSTVSGATPTAAQVPYLDGLLQFLDLDSNGWDDLLMTGAYFPFNGTQPTAKPGYVAFQDATGYAAASSQKFPYASLMDVHAREFALADFNGDGVKDLFVADHGYDASPFPGYQNQLFLSQSGAANWVNATANLPQVSDFTHSVATGDVNGDGKLDIFAGNGGLNAAYFLIGNGAGGFTQNSAILPINSGQALQNVQVGLTSSALVDLDGDGLPELVLGTGYLFRANQVLWNSGGSYANGVITSLPTPANSGTTWSIYEVTPTDLNGDGKQDLLLVYNNDVTTGGWQIQFLVNQGNKQFVDQTTTYLPDASAVTSGPVTSTSHCWIAFATPRDLNGDGRMDFWLTTNGVSLDSNCPVALIRQADGSFIPVKVGDLSAAGMPAFFMNGLNYAARGTALPGQLSQPFVNSSNQVQINQQVIAFR